VLLGNFGFPKRGPGYLDLTRIDDRLREATVATARQIELFETGERLAPMRGDARVTLLSVRSFQSYATARAHLREPKLPPDTLLQGASLTASALGATPDTRLLTPLYETCVAAVVVLLAIENVVAPRLRRRWLIASVVGVLSGFDVGHVLADEWQFAGAHAVVSAVSFNLGVALGEL